MEATACFRRYFGAVALHLSSVYIARSIEKIIVQYTNLKTENKIVSASIQQRHICIVYSVGNTHFCIQHQALKANSFCTEIVSSVIRLGLQINTRREAVLKYNLLTYSLKVHRRHMSTIIAYLHVRIKVHKFVAHISALLNNVQTDRKLLSVCFGQ